MQLPSMDLGTAGIWTSQFDFQPAAKAREAAADLEKLGFGAIWFPESVGRESLTHAGLLLGATKRIVIATGIVNIYGRDPVTTAAAQKTLAEAYPGRFLLGLGVSHIPLVEQIRGPYLREAGRCDARVPGWNGRGALPRSATAGKASQSISGAGTQNVRACRRTSRRRPSVLRAP
jgi:hypothetical protein